MKAMVLCAGRGTRLGALTAEIPKPLLPIGDEPLLVHTLRYLAGEGVTEVVVNVHHLGEQIEAAIGHRDDLGLDVVLSREEALLGTAGSVRRAAPLLGDEEPVVVLYGDLLIDQRLDPLVEGHRASGADVTMLVHRRVGSNSIVELDDDEFVTRFTERPTDDERLDVETWVNSGVYVLAPGRAGRLPATVPLDFPRDVFPGLIATHRLHAHPLDGFRVAIDSPDRLEEARAAFADGGYRPGAR